MDRSFLVSKKGVVLLVVDVQEKFRGAIPKFDDIVANVVRLVLTFQMYDLPIMVTEQYPAGLGPTVDAVRKLFSFVEIIEKLEFAATDNAHFWPQVNAIKPDRFVVCGLETHVCVNQTVIKLLEKGMKVHVMADAVGSRNAFDHNVALRTMERAGACIGTTEMCLFELTEKAGGESFKNIQRMVRGKLNLNILQKSGAAPARAQTIGANTQGQNGPVSTSPPDAFAAQQASEYSDEKTPTASPDEVMEMIDTGEAAAASARTNSESQDSKDAAHDSGENVDTEALLATIEAQTAPSKPSEEKSESEIDKDIKDIDNLLGNLGISDNETK